MSINIKTLRDLKKSNYAYKTIKQELSNNLQNNLSSGISSFDGIHGYEDTVIPDLERAILSSHNNQTKQVRYIDCVPTSLGDINFESTASGQEFITFAASFRFNYFELV